MSDLPIEPTNLPREGSKIEPRGYLLAVSFHPPINLSATKQGYELASKLSDYVEPSDVRIAPSGWTFAQSAGASPRSKLEIKINSNVIQIEAAFPTQASEWFETRQEAILDKFGEQFSPKLMVQVTVIVRGELPIDGDAREFLGNHIMRLDTTKLRKAIGRPIHVLGMRLDCPPFVQTSAENKGVLAPQVSVRIESLAENPNRLYLEAVVGWPDIAPWDDNQIHSIAEKLGLVQTYLEKDIQSYLRATGELE